MGSYRVETTDEAADRQLYLDRKQGLLGYMEQAGALMNEAREDHPGNRSSSSMSFLVDAATPRDIAGDEVRQMGSCIGALQSLATAFSAASAHFVENSWEEDPTPGAGVRLTYPQDGYEWRHAARTLMEQAATDLNIYQQAVQQRRRARQATTAAFGGNLWQNMTLHVADLVAQMALRPACSHDILSSATAVCYLGPRYDIRLVPYHSVLLVGIPYTSLPPAAPAAAGAADAVARRAEGKMAPSDAINHDYLAIPHEVGHHIFQYGRAPESGRSVQECLDDWFDARRVPADDWRRRWLEEVFADAYGCLVAGPVSVLAFQQYLRGRPRHSGRTQEVGDHPFYELRPLVQTRFLRRIDFGRRDRSLFVRAPDMLDERWLNILGYDPRTEYFVVGANMALPGHAILDALDLVSDLILDTMAALRPTDTQTTWSRDLIGRRDNVQVLMQDFQERYSTWKFEPSAEGSRSAELPQSWQERLAEISRQSVAWKADEWAENALRLLGWSTEVGAGSAH